MSLIENLNWRHAVKAYDPTKKVSQENIDKIVEAARLAPTSSGLITLGVLIAVFSTLFAAWRYLRLKTDQLY